MESFGLKDALRNGISPDKMLADFQEQLLQAQREVANEQAAASQKLDSAREEMIDSIIAYCVAVGVIPSSVDTSELREDCITSVKDAERELNAARPLIGALSDLADAIDKNDTPIPDEVIRNFLKTLS